MKLRTLAATFSPWAWLVMAAAALSILIVGYLWLSAPAREAKKAAEAYAARMVAEGRVQAAGDAVGTLDKTVTIDRSNAQQSEDDIHALRNAPGYSDPVNRDLNRTGRRGLCNDPAYARDPQCVQHADSAKPTR